LPGAVREVFGRKKDGPDHDKAVAAAEAVSPVEKAWLDGQIQADGERDPLEQALIDFIAEESGTRDAA
jgi:hypothetical protein